MSEVFFIGVWIAGWVLATVFTAVFIGNVDNVRGSGDKSFPLFIFPLLFGWSWPAVVVLGAIIAPLSVLSDRATKRNTPQ